VVRNLDGVEGGEGMVVRAERTPFAGDPVGYRGPVSLKLLTGASDTQVAALQARWYRLSQIEHPNLARPLEAFTGPGLSRHPDLSPAPDERTDVCYLSTIWVEGKGLRELLPLDPAGVVDLVWDIAAGLKALHRRELIHRDLHPGNVIVDGSGHAVLIDFGSTRPADGTVTATVSGVLGFIAPECLHGQETAATDRWGLGTLTVFMLLGHPQGQVREDQLRAELETALAGIGGRRQAVDLICQMVDTDPDTRPHDVVGWARDLAACLEPVSPRRRWLLRAAAVVSVVALGAGLAVRTLQSDSDSSTPSTEAPAAERSPTCERSTPGQDALAGAISNLAPDACLAGAASIVGDTTYQPLQTPAGDPTGGVLLLPDGTSVRLTEAMWTSFQAIAGNLVPDNAVRFRGNPAGVRRLDDPPAVIMQLGRGVLIGPRDDTQMFWVPGPVMNLWLQHGGSEGDLGFPTSNPYIDAEGVHLDFERGVMHSYGDADAIAAIVAGGPVDPLVEHPTSEVDLTTPDLAGHIVQQLNGTRWWVDDESVRHWIPDNATWECLGGVDNVHLDGLHGWEIAALPLGPAATCN
jgi:hypothetical protein